MNVRLIKTFLLCVCTLCSAYLLHAGNAPVQFGTALQRTQTRVAPEWYIPNTIVIKTKSYASLSSRGTSVASVTLQKTLSQLGSLKMRAPFVATGASIQATKSSALERMIEIAYSSPMDAYDACVLAEQNPEVEYAYPVFIRKHCYKPNDTQVPQQWWLDTIRAFTAWDIARGSATMLIANVDSGVDFEHEDMAANLWINPGEDGNDSQGKSKRTNGVDDDNNGRIDDYRGWDFIGNVSRTELISGTVKPDNDPKPRGTTTDQASHGTNSAGCMSAVSNNAKGIASSSFLSKYIPIKCGSEHTTLQGSVLSGYEAINYAARLGAKVINCSWGGPGGSQAEQDVINDAVARGAVVVAASGNDGLDIDNTQFFPACYSNVLCVGSTSQNGRVSGFSNFGFVTDVYAPGDGVRSVQMNNGYGNVSGTSFACPITAGVVGLVYAQHPTWTPRQVMHQIRATSDNILAPTNRIKYFGRLNAFRAVNTNQTFDQGTTMPGLEIVALKFNDTSAINQQSGTLRLVVENVLSTAQNVTAKIQLLDANKIALGTSDILVGTVKGRDTTHFTTQVTVSSPYWFTEDVRALVTFTAPNGYTEYQYITIPVRLRTSNTYTQVQPLNSTVFYTAVHARSLLSFWAVGKNGNAAVFTKRTSSTTTFDTIATDDPTCVFGIDNNRALVGTSSNGVYRTTNGGTSWSKINTAGLHSIIYGINIYDATNGIMLGSPNGTAWNVSTSSDNGATWQKGAALPTPLSSEQGIASSVTYLGDHIWMGTNRGRVLHSTDKGQTWSVATAGTTTVTHMAFANAQFGCAVMRNTGNVTENATVVVTTDGGATWKATGYVFSTNGVLPTALYLASNGTQILAACQGSQVLGSLDSGKTWNPVLSKNGTTANCGAGFTNAKTSVVLTLAGRTVGQLTIPFVGTSNRILTAPQSVEFDTVNNGSTKLKSFEISNTGDTKIDISSITIAPADANTETGTFSILSSAVTSLEVGAKTTLRLNFKGLSLGSKNGVITINSNASTPALQVTLHGTVVEPNNTSVEESTLPWSVSLTPNPAQMHSQCMVQTEQATELRISLVDISGKQLQTIFNGVTEPGIQQFSIHSASLAQGSYFVVIQGNGFTESIPFQVTR